MTKSIIALSLTASLFSCKGPASGGLPIQGTWQLISAKVVTKNDSTVTDYTKGQKMIKIINDSHFAFLKHDLTKGKDTATATYGSGGGIYTLRDNKYTELLEYCNARAWEGKSFEFTVSIINDTLLQTGIEKLPEQGIDQVITEKYLRVK